ncbi:MAG: dihydrodipicolinate synthase family protein [bacterium]|nr:dihydrodipicolinate synthase family protein [bacterium]
MSEKNIEIDNQMFHLNGIYPPVPTPFDKDGKLHLEALKSNIGVLNQFDLRGYVVMGSNGEFVLLSPEEKVLLMEAAREVIPTDKLMIAGTGCPSTDETIALTKKAAAIGADAALVLTPHYYRKMMTPQVLISYFNTVADMSPIPVLIYNMPACTGIDLDAETILAMADHPNIIGLKDSGGNVTKMGEIRQFAGPGFQVLAGSAGFLLPALSMGAVGGVLALANIAPAQCIGIHRFYQEGRRQEARELQVQMVPVNSAVTSKWGVPALKTAMDLLGLYGGPVRLPLLPIEKETKQKLEAVLMRGGLK